MIKKYLFLIFVFAFYACKDALNDISINPIITTNENHLTYKATVSILDSTFIPQHTILNQNYPNPFNNQTTIQFSVSAESFVKIVLLDSFNNEVAKLIDKKLSPGYYSIMISSNDFKSGIYYYKITTNEFVDIKEMLVIKNH